MGSETAPGMISVGLGGDYIWRDRRSRERRARLMAGITTLDCPGPGARCLVRAEATQIFRCLDSMPIGARCTGLMPITVSGPGTGQRNSNTGLTTMTGTIWIPERSSSVCRPSDMALMQALSTT